VELAAVNHPASSQSEFRLAGRLTNGVGRTAGGSGGVKPTSMLFLISVKIYNIVFLTLYL
jgi:hypothetical protein